MVLEFGLQADQAAARDSMDHHKQLSQPGTLHALHLSCAGNKAQACRSADSSKVCQDCQRFLSVAMDASARSTVRSGPRSATEPGGRPNTVSIVCRMLPTLASARAAL